MEVGASCLPKFPSKRTAFEGWRKLAFSAGSNERDLEDGASRLARFPSTRAVTYGSRGTGRMPPGRLRDSGRSPEDRVQRAISTRSNTE